MAEHTPEPWTYHHPWIYADLDEGMGTAIASVDESQTDFEDADGARIVACVNACAGIEHPEVLPEFLERVTDLFEWIGSLPKNEVLDGWRDVIRLYDRLGVASWVPWDKG